MKTIGQMIFSWSTKELIEAFKKEKDMETTYYQIIDKITNVVDELTQVLIQHKKSKKVS